MAVSLGFAVRTAEEKQEEDPPLAFLLLKNFGQVIMASIGSSVTLGVGFNGISIPALLSVVLLSLCLKPKIISHPSEHRYYKEPVTPWDSFVLLWLCW